MTDKITDKRQAILNSALKLFVEFGFHGTPTSKIAHEAGIANGTLFHYFKTKDELILALYDELKSALARYLEHHTSAEAPIKEAFQARFVYSLYWALLHDAEFRFMQLFDTSPYRSHLGHHAFHIQAQEHIALIEQGIRAKVIKNLPADFIYTLIANHAFGLHQYLVTARLTESKQKKRIHEAFELLWDMITEDKQG